MLIALLFALGAVILNSVAALLQSDATTRTTRHRPLIVQPRYLSGLVFDGLGWVCTVVALRSLPVFAVQAVLGGAIAVTALAARLMWGVQLRAIDRLAVGACMVGLGLVAASAADVGGAAVGLLADVVLTAVLVGLAVALLGLRNVRSAWPLALVAGLAFGGTSLAVHAVHLGLGAEADLLAVLRQPSAYLVIGFWLIGMVSYSRSLGRGELSTVTAVFTITESIVPGLLGIALLGDRVRPGWGGAFGAGLLLATAGVLVLARSPAQQRHQWSR